MVNRQQPSSPLGADVAVTHILVVTDPARSRDLPAEGHVSESALVL
jgi:hypothetical protein